MKQDKKPRDKPIHLWVPYFYKGVMDTQWGKDGLFNKRYWKTGQLYVKQ